MGTDAKKPAKQKSRLHMTHAQNDARYIAQGMTLFLSPNPDSAKDLARMNKGKNGRPFIYDEETMMVIARIVYQLGLACRGCEGLAIMALGEENAPDHTTIWRRINKMKICVNSMLCLMARPQIHLPNVKTCLDVVNTYARCAAGEFAGGHEPPGNRPARRRGADVATSPTGCRKGRQWTSFLAPPDPTAPGAANRQHLGMGGRFLRTPVGVLCRPVGRRGSGGQ